MPTLPWLEKGDRHLIRNFLLASGRENAALREKLANDRKHFPLAHKTFSAKTEREKSEKRKLNQDANADQCPSVKRVKGDSQELGPPCQATISDGIISMRINGRYDYEAEERKISSDIAERADCQGMRKFTTITPKQFCVGLEQKMRQERKRICLHFHGLGKLHKVY